MLYNVSFFCVAQCIIVVCLFYIIVHTSFLTPSLALPLFPVPTVTTNFLSTSVSVFLIHYFVAF